MNMKKMFSISIFLILSLLISLALGHYDTATNKVTLTLKKGWQTVPIFGGPNFGNDCNLFGKEEFVGAGWIWSPTFNEYVLLGLGTDTEKYKKDFEKNKYYYTVYGGMFLYLTKDCKIWINEYGKIGPDNFKITKGWQFIPKLPWMQKKGFDVFKKCDIEKFNLWDAEKQKWKYNPSTTSIDELRNKFNKAEIGEDVFLIKFSSGCELDVGIADVLPQPPALE